MNQLITKPKSESKLVLLWSRCEEYEYNYNFDLDIESIDANNDKDKDITWITLESKSGKQFFSGRNLENIITILQYDPLALSCWVSRDLDKLIISKKKKEELNTKNDN